MPDDLESNNDGFAENLIDYHSKGPCSLQIGQPLKGDSCSVAFR